MKKRTKRKIHNRIIKKLISGQTLSSFDKKYHESMVRKVYIKNATKIKSAADFSYQRKLVDDIRELPNTESLVWIPKVQEPSKWERVKNKVKGWFGK